MSVTSKNGTRAQKTADDGDAMRRKSEELSVKCSERGTREGERELGKLVVGAGGNGMRRMRRIE